MPLIDMQDMRASRLPSRLRGGCDWRGQLGCSGGGGRGCFEAASNLRAPIILSVSKSYPGTNNIESLARAVIEMGQRAAIPPGAAMRDAGSILKRQPNNKKLLLVVTDGEPADNDVRDPQYLRYDARKAVEELTRNGITPYCLSLDPRADEYVSRIFGAKNYMVMDQIQRLPEKLPALYMGLIR